MQEVTAAEQHVNMETAFADLQAKLNVECYWRCTAEEKLRHIHRLLVDRWFIAATDVAKEALLEIELHRAENTPTESTKA